MRSPVLGLLGALVAPLTLVAQQAPANAAMPKVGDMAPDFTLAAGTRAGIADKPVTLSSLRGRTVVLAFYPRQRSSGCTIQMPAAASANQGAAAPYRILSGSLSSIRRTIPYSTSPARMWMARFTT